MNSLITPAIAFMNRLRYPQKMVMIALLFLIPLAVTAYIVVQDSSEKLTTIEEQKIGLEYIQKLGQLQQHISAHRGISFLVMSNQTSSNKLQQIKADIAKDLIAIDEATLQSKTTLPNAAKRWSELKTAWLNLNERTDMKARENVEAHNKLLDNTLKLISDAAKDSGLFSDKKNIHLIIALVSGIPASAEHIGLVRTYGAMALSSDGDIPVEDKAKIMVELEGGKTSLQEIDSDLNVAFGKQPALSSTIRAPLEEVKKNNLELMKLVKDEIIDEGWNVTADKFFTFSSTAVDNNFTLIYETGKTMDQIMNNQIDAAKSRRSMVIIIMAVSLSAVLYFFIGFYKSTILSINALISTARRVADGDLRARVECISNDELGMVASSFNNMAEQFRKIIQQMTSTNLQLAAAAEEMSSISNDSQTFAFEQQKEITQVAAAINEMSASVQEVVRNAASAAQTTDQADQSITQGRKVISSTVSSINQLANQVENASSVINNLEKESDQIGGVLEVISGIAEQTNLLALNAAIEAARAGEQGRGFAVVADEVRTLAQRTKTSTLEIQSMIEKFHNGTAEAVKVMNLSHKQAQEGRSHAEQAGVTFNEIAEHVNKITSMNHQTSIAAEQQSCVAEEINRNIHNVSQIVDQATVAVKQTATSSSQLAKLASDSQTEMSRFKT